ncbi:MAG: hypothetical protein HY678_06305 [Chloroflexi bacterium]|nr:hypothetical protein [Chloroflexota bacterium]
MTNGLLDKIDLEPRLKATHSAITEQRLLDGAKCDAWYTERQRVVDFLLASGREIATTIRTELGITWNKPVPVDAAAALDRAGTYPRNWEDGPDGALAGAAILLAGWVANQSGSKATGDSPQAGQLFTDHIRPLIKEAMNLGFRWGQDARSR